MCGIAGTILSVNNISGKKITLDYLNKTVDDVVKNSKKPQYLLNLCWKYKSNINFISYFKNSKERKKIEILSKKIYKLSQLYLKDLSKIDKKNHINDFNIKYQDYESLLDCYWFLDNELPSLFNSIKYFYNSKTKLNENTILFYKKLINVINAIDNRLEFRGRDSLGISIQLK